MNKKRFLGLTGIFLLLVTLLGQAARLHPLSAAAANNKAEQSYITEYPIPAASSGPRNIIATVAGEAWFTAQDANAIGRLVVTSTTVYDFTLYPLPTPASEPYDLVYDGSSIWFTELAGNQIGRLDPATGTITEYPIPTANSAPTGIDVAPDGRIWFVERDGNKVGVFDPNTAQFTEKLYSRDGALLSEVVTNAPNSVWFLAPGLAIPRLVEYKPIDDVFLEATVGDPGVTYMPSHVVLDEGGSPWVSTSDTGFIGRFTPSTVTFFIWRSVSPPGAFLAAMDQKTAGGQRTTWFVERNSGYVGQMVTNLDNTLIISRRQPLPTLTAQPAGVAAGPDGSVWITEPAANQIAVWQPPYFREIWLPLLLKPN